MPRHFAPLASLVLAAFLVCGAAMPAAAENDCTSLTLRFAQNEADLCYGNAGRVGCGEYCSHLPGPVREFSVAELNLGSVEMYERGKYDEWEQCFIERHLPCRTRKMENLNDCLERALVRFHTRWLACPEAGTAFPPILPRRLRALGVSP